jgi:predicted dehydrogenase
MKQNKVKWGILGTGNIALTQMIPAILQSNNGMLFGIAGRNPEKTARFAELFSPVKTYTGYDAMLEDPEVEAVYIPLPNANHYEWVIKALDAGKHVFCEKPMGLNLKEVLGMQKKAREKGLVLMEAFPYLHSPNLKRLREIVQGREIGELRWISTWFTNILYGVERESFRLKAGPGAGSIYDLGCYTLSFVRFVTGKDPVNFHARGIIDENNVEMTTTTLLEFDETFSAVMLCSFEAEFSAGFEIIGTKGRIEGPEFMYNASGRLAIKIRTKEKDTVEWIHCPNNYMLEAEQFGRILREAEKPHLDEKFTQVNVDLLDRIHHQVFER